MGLVFISIFTFSQSSYATVPTSSPVSINKQVSSGGEIISPEIATSALEKYIRDNGLKHADQELILQEFLYDVDDTLVAYYFTVKNDDGYYIVTAVDSLNPINEYSEEGNFPTDFKEKGDKKAYYLGPGAVVFLNNTEELKAWFQDSKKQQVELFNQQKKEFKAVQKETKIKKEKLIIEIKAGNNLSAQSRNAITEKQTLVDTLSEDEAEIQMLLEDVTAESEDLERGALEPFDKDNERNEFWDELLSETPLEPASSFSIADEQSAFDETVEEDSTPEEIIVEDSYEDTIIDPITGEIVSGVVTSAATSYSQTLLVERFYQRGPYVNFPKSACGPTTAAMIMDYYHDVRKFNIRDETYFSGTSYDQKVGKLINNMRSDMGAGLAGSTLRQLSNGMIKHINETATSTWSYTEVKDPHLSSYNNSLKYRNALNNRHPVGIRFDYNSDTTGLKYHFVVGVEWRLAGAKKDDLKIGYKNPDGITTGIQTIDWGNNVKNFEFTSLSYK